MARNYCTASEILEYIHSNPYLFDYSGVVSVGVFYKQSEGRRIRRLCIRFGVRGKLPKQTLKDQGYEIIPNHIKINNIYVPTDVVARPIRSADAQSPTGGPLVAAHSAQVAPGMFVQNKNAGIAPGTIGAIVKRGVGTKNFILSAHHVLNGRTVATPPRSTSIHSTPGVIARYKDGALDNEGDCAIAEVRANLSVSGTIPVPNRRRNPFTITRLPDNVSRSPRLIAAKVGAATQLTYAAISGQMLHQADYFTYGGPLRVQISAFELEPLSRNHPLYNPQQTAISAGGDSGALWVLVDSTGDTTGEVVGLHYYGERSGSGSPVAIACHADDVFARLNIQLA